MFKTLLVSIVLALPPNAALELGTLVSVALNYHGLDGKIDLLSSAAASRNWLPEITIDADFQRTDGLDQDRWQRYDREDTTLLHQWTQGRTDQKLTDRWQVGVKLTWNLRELIFDDAQVATARIANTRRSARIELADRVTTLYFDWFYAEDARTKQEMKLRIETLIGRPL